MKRAHERVLTSLVAGALFGVGLAVSGMTQPRKVIGFLDFAGAWDPSLAFVMLGAKSKRRWKSGEEAGTGLSRDQRRANFSLWHAENR